MMLVSVALCIVVLKTCKGIVEAQAPVLLRQLDLVDKTTTLAAAADLQAYQGIQAMGYAQVGYDGENYDPSDEAERVREAERHNLSLEEADAEDIEKLRSLF